MVSWIAVLLQVGEYLPFPTPTPAPRVNRGISTQDILLLAIISLAVIAVLWLILKSLQRRAKGPDIPVEEEEIGEEEAKAAEAEKRKVGGKEKNVEDFKEILPPEETV
jgi:hypothetical protein